jgi:hypothetical protein
VQGKTEGNRRKTYESIPSMRDDQDLIEDYCQNRLSEKDSKSVEERCRRDPEFDARVRQERLIREATGDKAAQDFVVKTDTVIRRSGGNDRMAGKGRLHWWLLAASFLVIVLAYFLSRESTADLSELYAEYYEPYPFILSRRGLDEDRIKLLTNAYEEGQWRKVETEIQTMPDSVLIAPMRDLYLAVALLEQDRPEEARNLLQSYRDVPVDDLYQDILEWYLALVYLRDGDLTGTKEVLAGLNSRLPEGALRRKVSQLLQELP